MASKLKAAFDAAFAGDLSGLKSKVTKKNVNTLHPERETTLLYTACRFGRKEVAKWLLENGADVNKPNGEEGSESTPLHGAAYGGHHAILKELCARSAQLIENGYGDLPLKDAENPHEDVTKANKKKCVDILKKHSESLEDEEESEEEQKKTSPEKKKRKDEEDDEAEPPKAKKQKKEEKVKEKEKEKPKSKKKEPAEEDESPKPKKQKKEEEEKNDFGPEALKSAKVTMSEISRDDEAFWEIEERFNAHLQGRNDDYNKVRTKAGKKPLTFILKGVEKVKNEVLERRFEAMVKTMKEKYPKEKDKWRERASFHGTNKKNLPSILKTSLLRFKHPLNPCKSQSDDGWFGTNRKGVYVSKYADYTFKYANGGKPLDEGETTKVIMFRTLPGKSKHIPAVKTGMDPTPGFDSHSSPNYLEWYLFDEAQLCPDYVLNVQAKEDNRTAADDGDDGASE